MTTTGPPSTGPNWRLSRATMTMLLSWLILVGVAWFLFRSEGESNKSLWEDLTSTQKSVRELPDSAQDGKPAISQLREDTQSVPANADPSLQAVEQARRASLAVKTAAMRDRLQKLKALQAAWQAKSVSLLSGDLGRRIAASPAHLELVLGLLQQERPTADQIQQWEAELQPLATPLEQTADGQKSYLTIVPQHLELLEALDRQVTSAVQRCESQQLLLEAIEQETAGLTAQGEPLERLLRDRQIAAEKKSAEALAQAREAALQAREQSKIQLEREAAEAETKRQAQKLQAEKDRIEQLAKSEREQIAEETRVREAEQRAKIAGLQAEAKRADEAIRAAQLERDFERVRGQVVEHLSTFTGDGFAFRPDGTKGPASLAHLRGQGALEPTRVGYEKLSRLMSYSNDRPRGPIPHHIELFGQQGSLAPIERAQEFLNRYGEVMVKQGLLAP